MTAHEGILTPCSLPPPLERNTWVRWVWLVELVASLSHVRPCRLVYGLHESSKKIVVRLHCLMDSCAFKAVIYCFSDPGQVNLALDASATIGRCEIAHLARLWERVGCEAAGRSVWAVAWTNGAVRTHMRAQAPPEGYTLNNALLHHLNDVLVFTKLIPCH